MSGVETSRIIDVLSGPEANGDQDLARWTSGPSRTSLVSGTGEMPTELARVRLPYVLDDRLVMLRESQSARARSYRLLRHRLLSASDPRIVAVTSARAGDGKTTCALNLALAIAEDVMTRVLLLEANLQRPCLGRLLGFEPETPSESTTRPADMRSRHPVAAISRHAPSRRCPARGDLARGSTRPHGILRRPPATFDASTTTSSSMPLRFSRTPTRTSLASARTA